MPFSTAARSSSRAVARLFGRPAPAPLELSAGPLRGELLGAEALAGRARATARAQRLAAPARGARATPLLARLAETRRILDDAHARLAAEAGAGADVGPAGEWLLDNFHVVREHVREVRESLPAGYYRELPELAGGRLAGYPRVYELAITLISHSEGRVDLQNASLFVAAFQEVAPLTLGELWAVPAMLRLGLLESVRRMTLRTVQRLDETEAADAWAARIDTAAATGERALAGELRAFAGTHPPLSPLFVSRLLHQVRLGHGGLPALQGWLAARGVAAERATAQATQHLALTQVMMANSITSLRGIGLVEWRAFVEAHSAVEAVLRGDPAGVYASMTFATRDRYRHAVERIAKGGGRGEAEVARAAVALAAGAGTAAEGDADPRRGHVGWWLVDGGRGELERAQGYRPTPGERVHRRVLRHPDAVFGGGIGLGTAAALAAALALAPPPAGAPLPLALALALVAGVLATDVAVGVVNQLVAVFLPPRLLPRLDLSERGGIPPALRTAVVVPILFDGVAAVHQALEHLEVQYLANRQPNLHFALLGDFTDAAAETRPGDAAIEAAARDGVRALNARYAAGAEDAFYLFLRPRRWNPREGAWMGWERKRGKLAEFNRFVRGGGEGAFSAVVGDVAALRGVRYVITLDADTVLPPGTAARLVGALAHPLNRAGYDPRAGRVTRGYGILQPRVGVSLPSAHASRFAAIHSGHPGVDPYTTAVSDVYQDLYGEGSFTGKGIYDLDAFERATHGRFPENALLSHDLIEGSYARAGLATDLEVYDDYPARYLTHARRRHRWIRGDWQLLRWLGPRVPGPDGPEPNRLSLLSRWKILDNLRRSTVEVAQLAFFAAGWLLLPGSPLRWTGLGVLAVAAPWIVSLLLAAARPPRDRSWRAWYAAVGRDAATGARQVGLALAFLPHQAWISADAIARTLWRLFVTRRHLLQWQTASVAERTVSASPRAAWRAMGPAAALAAGVGAAAVAARPGGTPPLPLLAAVVPLALLWILSPAIAHALGKPSARRGHRLSPTARAQAMRYALLHWRYFDRFVTAGTHGLVPDNFQEDPEPVVAMRTSPTNLGLQLLATASACDLGFITAGEMAGRLETAFRALERMRRFRGHFYNWYDLNDLSVLEPAYVSTVDSGNLAGHLVALRQACLEIAGRALDGGRTARALEAAFSLAARRLDELATSPAVLGDASARAAAARAAEQLRVARAQAGAGDAPAAAGTLRGALEGLRAAGLAPDGSAPAAEWIAWSLRRIDEERAMELEIGAGPGPAGGDVAAGEGDGRREGEDAGPRPPTLRELAAGSTAASELVARLEAVAERAYRYALEMDFRFLFDGERKLFSIGYQVAAHTLDPSTYDLLASEARLASFVAIARGDVPAGHWFRLGRTLTHAAGHTALVSWSGSMFEYLMPALVMRSLPATLLDQSGRGAVRRQQAWGAAHGVPWGVSESAYNLRDRHLTYQYRAFGVPDLALKRGLGRDRVVAPYASALAAVLEPQRALANLGVLEKMGALGPYGFRDALDFTRPDPGARFALVGNYMAHHVGMTLVALDHVLEGAAWQRRFHADPLVRAAELLLHERIPRRLALQEPQEARPDEALPDPDLERPAVREIHAADTPQPHVALLGRLPYTLMVSHCGSGYSRYGELAVTRWRADGTTDHTGQFCYLKDVEAGRAWSAAHQPVCAPADVYHAHLATDRVTFHRADGPVETRTEITVVPGDHAEVRRVTVTNTGDRAREVELTSYGEIVLGPPDADRVHPAFANLFVETEYHPWCTAVTATRRPRSSGEAPLWCVHVVDAGPHRVGEVTCETDRARFLGRGRSTRAPLALERDGPLSGTTGAVLDPVFALRTRLRLEPGQSASAAFTTLVAESRAQAFELAGRYHDSHAAQRALDLAWTSTQVELRELGVTPAEAAVFQELAGHLFYATPELRAPAAELLANRGSQPLLWAGGVSGDRPIVLAALATPEGLPTLRQLFAAHHYWRRRGMGVDLVVVDEQGAGYLQPLSDGIADALATSSDAGARDQPGGVFVYRRELLPADQLRMLRATARLHLECDGRSLGRILAARLAPDEPAGEGEPDPVVVRPPERRIVPAPALRRPHGGGSAPPSGAPALPARRASDGSGSAEGGAGPESSPALRFDNGYGGLTAEGDYEVRVRGDRVPPAPWANVVANPRGGFLVTERGGGCTWAENSYFYRLTPWHNDPVSDPPGEVLYLRDEESGELWSATPAPVRRDDAYVVRHGAGWSSFAHEHAGIAAELTLAMAGDDAVKVSTLRVANRGAAPRRISLTAYVEWTLGVLREHTQHQVRTEVDEARGAVFARNFFDPQFAGEVAFCALSEPLAGHTGDRREFIGRNGTLAAPAGLRDEALGGRHGAGLDPCAALQCVLELAPGQVREVVFLLGAAAGEDEARRMVDAYRDPGRAAAAVARGLDGWARRLSAVTVRTPEPAFDAMVNRWTLYQALACRMWARTALYQSSGAYGFRDQLQDVMAFVHAEPALAREHIVRAAARQFVEGDVQHWWHPQSGRGVRTRFSDDLAWLPYVACHYVRVTGDASVLDEPVPFLSMRPLAPDEHEVYELPAASGEVAGVYEHCLRALRRACTRGAHGLPLIGTGDWNDGMNRVGVEGRGESVWLAWFLADTLRRFAVHAEERSDGEAAAELRATADAYAAAVEAHGWDGAWYRRAYFDDGTPLGSAGSDECRIDAIAQSWSVISDAGDPARRAMAMRSLEAHLVRGDERLLLLLAPPFDRTEHDPGYIKGYLPGVRENGAQYTHAALWSVLATALSGDGNRAFELYQMVNPLTHASTPAGVAAYKVEPYVVAADVYTAKGQEGRGGWTWYTGSASWMYRVGLEAILGFDRRGDRLVIRPCVPDGWGEYSIDYRFGSAVYAITVHDPARVRALGAEVAEVSVDGRVLDGAEIPLVDDGARHEVAVRPVREE
ncbi:MAG: GH36-type glycosyl hydrolase domain-containing protein [Longimicrobiaceae bacterium]